MIKCIRGSCFETNSSSMHSIVVTKQDEHVNPDELIWDSTRDNSIEALYLDKDGVWRIYHSIDGYERAPFELLTTFEDKFKYALCEYCGYYHGDEPEFMENYQMLVDLACEIVPGLSDLKLSTRDVDIYNDENGNPIPYKELHYDSYDKICDRANYFYYGEDGGTHMAAFDEENYLEIPGIGPIDHQSAGMLKRFLQEKGIDLKEFLTNKKYVIVIDGDELCIWDKYKKSGLINMGFIKEEFR